MFRFLCVVIFLFLIAPVSKGQIIPQKIQKDTTQVDSTQADSLNQIPGQNSDRMKALLDSVREEGQNILIIDPNAPQIKLTTKIINTVKDQLPEITEIDTKLKLKLKFPWRDDIIIPLPKAFKNAGERPPFDPDMAYQRSLIIPGWGQAYNKSYWKIPIFYAGYGGFIWWINYNNSEYQRHSLGYRCAIDAIPNCILDPEFISFDADGIRTRRDKFRRDRDFAVIVMLGWHLLHVIEAYVDAHLRGFDVSEDLSLNAQPILMQPLPGSSANSFSPGPGLQFSFSF